MSIGIRISAWRGGNGRPARLEAETVRFSMSLTLTCCLAALFLVTVAWAAFATYGFVYRDDLVARVSARQADMQLAYEERLSALRSELDRVASHRLLERDGLESRVAELLTRQAQLETRQTIVAALADQARFASAAGSTKARNQLPVASMPSLPPPLVSSFAPIEKKPSPLPDGPEPRGNDPVGDAAVRPRIQSRLFPEGSLDEKLTLAHRSIRSVETAQLTTIEEMTALVQRQTAKLKSLVGDIGLDPDRVGAAENKNARGGPLVPLNIDPKTGYFEARARHLQAIVASFATLRQAVAALPLARPMPSEAEATSDFGVRIDPFTRGYAMHTGIDFRAEGGTPVQAAGPGRIVTADYSGGYGNMVEIEHGNGITTRYAHLSSIAVQSGQEVVTGSVLGRVGSTGRSTGPHLHYETRVGGEPIDPRRFLKSGLRHRESLQSAFSSLQSTSATSAAPP